MSAKQKIMWMLERLPEDVSYDEVLYHIVTLRDIAIGLEQAARGEGIEHDEFFAQLEAEGAAENHLDASSDAIPEHMDYECPLDHQGLRER